MADFFSLDPTKPLITAINVDGNTIVEQARPYYRITTGKRKSGWDAFFDFPATFALSITDLVFLRRGTMWNRASALLQLRFEIQKAIRREAYPRHQLRSP
jgi:hypothetical protein